MTVILELAANALNTISILLAGRNIVHTWWTGIVGCLCFAVLFFSSQLYADVTLQAFFIATSVQGWRRWVVGRSSTELPISHASPRLMIAIFTGGVLSALAYGWLLVSYTDAYAPFVDSIVLCFSIAAQLLLVGRRIETWWCWLLVNTLAVPLYLSRGLYLTAALYSLYWVNALVSWRRWRRLMGTV